MFALPTAGHVITLTAHAVVMLVGANLTVLLVYWFNYVNWIQFLIWNIILKIHSLSRENLNFLKSLNRDVNLQLVTNRTEKTVSIHAVLSVSIKRVIHLTEPAWQAAKINRTVINALQVLLSYHTRIANVNQWLIVTNWKKNMFVMYRRLCGDRLI